MGIKMGEKFLAYDMEDTIILKKLNVLKEKSIDAELEKIFSPAWKIAKERKITKKDVDFEIKGCRTEKKLK